MKNLNWVDFKNQIKSRYILLAPRLWWGDDLDVRFYLLKNLITLKNKKILDIGCNIGIALSFLDSSNELYGIEIDEYCVNEAKKLNPHAKIYKGSMDKLPYKDNCFDIIIMMNVLPYYDFPIKRKDKNIFIEDTMNEVYRVLKNGGKLYFSTPNGESIHYLNNKAKLKDVNKALQNFKYKVQGWNHIKPISPYLPKKFMFIPPKILCNLEFIWKYMIKNLDKNVKSSKYFYIEAVKDQNE